MKEVLNELLDGAESIGLSRRAFLGRVSALGLVAALGGTLVAPKGALAQEPTKGGILKMGLGGGESTDTLDPGLADGPVAFAVNRQWGDTIVNVGATNEIEPRLAESFEGNADATVWTFKIREGVKFHDGSPMTVDDVVATFKRHSDENAKSGAFGIMQGIAAIVRGESSELRLGNSETHVQKPRIVWLGNIIVGSGIQNLAQLCGATTGRSH